MLATLLDSLLNLDYLIRSPIFLIGLAFTIWMFIDALRRREWIWAALIFVFIFLAALFYFLMVYRQAPAATRGFELPGAHDRRRIRELQSQIHHLDNAHHHSQLGDIYFQQAKLDKAEACYRAALERDPEDMDTRAHLGQCLLRLNRPMEALPLLESVTQEDPRHDYGHSLMALAETRAALGQPEQAIAIWQQVTQNHSYPRAHVQLAELYLTQNQPEEARRHVQEVLQDAPHSPGFQKRRDKVWFRRARALARRLASA